jgi:uncharacterized protein YabE (DUF348 family)
MKNYSWYVISLILIAAGAALIFFGQRREFIVQIDGERRQVITSALTTGGVLKAAGAELSESDCVHPSAGSIAAPTEIQKLDRNRRITILAQPGNTELSAVTCSPFAGTAAAAVGLLLYPNDSLLLGLQQLEPSDRIPGEDTALLFRRAYPITITENGTTTTFYSSAASLGQALADKGYQLTLADLVSLPLETPITTPIDVSVQRAIPLVINVGGTEKSTLAAGPTVGEALAQAGFTLQGLDYSLPAESELLPADGKVKVVRVREETPIRETFLPYTTKYIEDPTTELDKQSIVSAGQQGIKAERERVRVEDGREVSRAVDSQWTVQEPTPEQRGYGTKVEIRTLDTPNGPVEYWRAVNVYATSYSPCRSGVSKCLNGTSSGMPVSQGTIGVTRAWYNWMVGQKLYVPGYGTGVIGDIGGGFSGKYWIDLAYTDDAYVPWSSYVTVYFLTPVPKTIPWILP